MCCHRHAAPATFPGPAAERCRCAGRAARLAARPRLRSSSFSCGDYTFRSRMKTEPLIKLLSWDEARAHASPIRFTVFCEEQGVPREIELDEQDGQSIHAIAYESTRAVGTA